MKALLYLIILLLLGSAGYWYYCEKMNPGRDGSFDFIETVTTGRLSKSVEIKKKQYVVTTSEGKKLHKTYKKTFSYSYSPNSSKEEQDRARKSAGRIAMRELIEEAEKDAKRIRQHLVYYRNLKSKLSHLKMSCPTTVNKSILSLGAEVVTEVKPTFTNYKVLSANSEVRIEKCLRKLVVLLLRERNAQTRSAAKNFMEWYKLRDKKYPVYMKTIRELEPKIKRG